MGYDLFFVPTDRVYYAVVGSGTLLGDTGVSGYVVKAHSKAEATYRGNRAGLDGRLVRTDVPHGLLFGRDFSDEELGVTTSPVRLRLLKDEAYCLNGRLKEGVQGAFVLQNGKVTVVQAPTSKGLAEKVNSLR